MELTEKWLGEIGGWQAMKEARQLVAAGAVRKATHEGQLVRGEIASARRPLVSGLRIRSRTDVENLCTCPHARRSGQICEHALAVALYTILPPSARGEPKSAPPASGATGSAGSGRPSTVEPLDVEAEAQGAFSVFLDEKALQPQAGQRRAIPVFLKWDPEGESERSALVAWLRRHQLPMQTAPLQLPPKELPNFLSALTDHPRVFVGKPAASRHQPLQIAQAELRPWLSVEGDAEQGRVALQLTEDPHPRRLTLGDRPWLYHPAGQCLHPQSSLAQDPLIDRLMESNPGEAIELRLRDFVRRQVVLDSAFHLDLQGELQSRLKLLPAPIRYHFHLSGGLKIARLQIEARLHDWKWSVRPDGIGFEKVNESLPIQDQLDKYRFYSIEGNGLKAVSEDLEQAGFAWNGPSARWELKGEREIVEFLAGKLPDWESRFQVSGDDTWSAAVASFERIEPTVEMSGSGEDWLSMSFQFEAPDGFRLSRSEALRMVRSGQSAHRGPGGKRYLMDRTALERLEEALQDVEVELTAEGARLSRHHRHLFEPEPVTEKPLEDQELDLTGTREALGGLGSTLRPYQLEGVAWLQQRLTAGKGVVLGDDMGLGKTLQSICCMRLQRAESESPQPILVVCPKSLIPNWQAELERFAPELEAVILTGTRRQERWNEVTDNKVILTTYQLVVNDLDQHLEVNYGLVVLDEASLIRNPDTATAKALFQLKARARIALTGTPVENGVQDLWSIYRFAFPGYLGTRPHFAERFEKPLKQGDAGAGDRLRRLIRPYFLRRSKTEVLKDLPAKLEQVLWCDMTDTQAEIYRRVLDEGREEIRLAQRRSGGGGARMTMLTVLLRLRQVCCDVRLVGLDPAIVKEIPVTEWSGKRLMLQDRLAELLPNGHKALIFSQFVSHLELQKELLTERDWDFCYLDGQTTNRGDQVRQFQTREDKRAFLISLKAGGYGLNLTAADQVFLLDPWWNPAVEAQAIDRAHRFGQARTVNAYRLVARGTIEERILALQEKKRGWIAAAVEDRSPMMRGLSDGDLEELLDE